MKKRLSLVLVALLSFLYVTACATGEETEQAENTPAQEDVSKEQTEGAFPVTLTDGLGEELVIEEKPERIVSLIPSNTEIAFALGLNDEIVGVTDYCNYPEEAAEKQSVGGMDFDMETLLALEPDLVLAHASSGHAGEEGFEQIKEAGIDVLVVNDAASFDDAYDSMKMIGKATGTEQKAEEIIADMKKDAAEIEEKAENIDTEEQKSVWVEIQPPPEIYTTGQGTFIHEMLETINAKNAAGSEEGWIPYSEEEAVNLQSDVIVTTYGYYVDNPSAEIKERAAWQEVPAVANGEVYDIHNDMVSRPGPRLTEGMQQLAELVYPDVFKEE
ncbi:iron complex transport system substrate-binding protein [Alteribacillus persepolensis]|uniref:Iron complex transport system substrate-binding protein n=1 Tax=Alteribacillus persepolensis TaxID=568899 RepID=A0A1G7ZLH1_9BACI|nr:ABC transporter substrate-binding protein [Alteribacillus persepolensis]SDH09437.1 iron complex transport system substrate-binding protein [Alteribacillus persepolensis]